MVDEAFQNLIEAFVSLPGIGKKSAYRIAFHILRQDANEFDSFIKNIQEAKKNLKFCTVCGAISQNEICSICTSSNRNIGIVCVVEEPEDIFFIENTGEFRGKYHVLNGAISPLDGIGPDEIRIKELLNRVQNENLNEILMATNPTLEGDATATYIASLLKNSSIKITRIAHGVAVGSNIEYADQYTLGKAIRSRLTL
ncbi:MAG: recombination mediator RecR [Leptospiraceae bacterium]|nr:recombination protein RecR [Leptospiraceae bacterium]MCK6381490.1 recombination mediator RecR [Leptospiraceae bacterium]NUM41739.1 recombination protein RecR [Leptospiraceae bacterium]